MTYFDFAIKRVRHSSKPSKNNFEEVQNYTMIIMLVFKLIFGIVFITSAFVGFFNMYKMINLYHIRKQKLIEYYALLVSKKNELDYVTSPAYKEERLRNIYGAYKPGERLVIFTGNVKVGTISFKNRRVDNRKLWEVVLLRGVNSLYTE